MSITTKDTASEDKRFNACFKSIASGDENGTVLTTWCTYSNKEIRTSEDSVVDGFGDSGLEGKEPRREGDPPFSLGSGNCISETLAALSLKGNVYSTITSNAEGAMAFTRQQIPSANEIELL